MKTLLFSVSFVLFSGLAFGQAKDLTKKQAYQMFVKSNVRKALGIKQSEFNTIIDTKNTAFQVNSESLILNSVNKEDLNYIKEMYYRGTHTRQKNGLPICDDCSNIIYWSKKELNETNKSFFPGG
ncbi:hypothetical protein HZP65_10805 [Elizabethkingia anophelis]|nr:hypothetical protein [Elizabethkingia anophelis]MCT4276663.1 hypothetical protein [Elizabethkingia anophelis]MCT4280242.1 hypothetical protein [Elizabethkingia anophelis]